MVKIITSVWPLEAARKVELSVEDEGHCIDETTRAHLFEPFYTTRADAGGTGLGLATVLGTAEQHGGTVRVMSRAGGGSNFTIVLPAVEEGTAEVTPTAATPSKSPRADARALTLLLIDDEAMVADVTRRMLERHDHKVLVATKPHDALAIWVERSAEIELVICDVVMAQMRGPVLVERMRQSGKAPRVLFITGYSEEAVRSELDHPVLAKLFTLDALMLAIRSVLQSVRWLPLSSASRK